MPAQTIDKGIPAAGLLAHVMVAKFADLLLLCCSNEIRTTSDNGIAETLDAARLSGDLKDEIGLFGQLKSRLVAGFSGTVLVYFW